MRASYFYRPGPEKAYFYSEIGLEVAFGTTLLQNRKPQSCIAVSCMVALSLDKRLEQQVIKL